jgi:cell division protease FtsH
MSDRQGRPGPKGTPASPRWIWPILLFLAILAYMASVPQPHEPAPAEIPYSELKALVRADAVSDVVIERDRIVATRAEPGPDTPERLRAVTPPQQDPDLLPLLEAHGVEVTAVAPPPEQSWILLWFLLPWLLVIGVSLWLSRTAFRGGLPGSGLGGLMSGRFAKPAEQKRRITFAEVAGQDEAKREVSELVDFLREPERFERVGAEVPHGVLLMGPPGTGKTLLARALAGEADVPFFSTSGSEFIEVFVGVGAGRVRKMFEEARRQAPAVIFIDELDSIGRTRGTGLGGGHDEREQTLNQILAELDGFDGKAPIVVLAATNRPDVLDPALLRPGRFDRHVTLALPDRAARRAILGLHARNLPLAASADLDRIAAGTPGFSGADLKNLLNEAAIAAARHSAAEISPADLEEARDKVMLGTVRTLAIQPDEKHRLAVHEAGHTAAAFHTPGVDPLYKVTIIPRGRALGGTHMLPEQERHTLPEDYLSGQLVTLLAGRAAEKVLIGSVSSGADDDIRRATGIARSMVARWGMDPEIGPVDLRESDEHPFLGQRIAQPRSFSDATAARVDAAVIALVHRAEAEAVRLIEAHREAVVCLVARLEAEETLDAAAIRACLAPDAKVTPLRRPDPGGPLQDTAT